MSKKTVVKQGKIKPKIVLGYLIFLGITLAALFVTYKGFVDLTHTRQTISEPSQKLIKLNSIVTDIYEAESSIRTYTLTHNERYLSMYLGLMKNINSRVDSLLILAQHDPVQIEKIRFTQELLNKKRKVLRELIELKKTDQSSQFYAKALEEVESIDLDSIQESSVIRSVTTTTRQRRDSVIKVANEGASANVFSRFFRWISGKESSDTSLNRLLVEIETQIDTLKTSVVSPSDSLVHEIIRILTQIKEQQETAMLNISEKELELLKSDKEIMDQLRTVLSLLEREELMNSYRMAEEVKQTVQKSTLVLLALGGFALFMAILFTWIIFRDLTRANYYRAQLLEAKQYAEKLLRVKEEFLANMNHEIRTPLSAIIGLSKRLDKESLHPDQERMVALINSSSEHLLQIVNDILDLSKIEGEYLKLETIPFIPNKVVSEAFDTLMVKAQEKGLSYNLNVNNLGKTPVVGDPFRLKQVVYNLLSNAIKFTLQGGINLSLNAHAPDDQNLTLDIRVSDTGIGISADKLDTIFEQFSQVDSGTSRQFGGTGLGLNIAKRLVELYKGTIQVSSILGQGSTFSVQLTLPIVDDEMIGELETSLTPRLPSHISILVVEDDPVGQLLIGEMLKTLGVHPTIAGDPLKALEMVQQNSYAVIITDIQMPGLSGFELSKNITSSVSNPPPVVAITANSQIAQQAAYAQSGLAGHLIKPFSELELYNAIAPLIGQTGVPIAEPLEGLSQEDYSIADIRRFANNDDESIRTILTAFRENFDENLLALKHSLENGDWNRVNALAHKMKSSFRQLKMYQAANSLEELENQVEPLIDQEKVDILNLIEGEVARAKSLLTEDLERLKK